MFARSPQEPMDTLIGASTRIDGHLLFKGGLRIDGAVHGNVTADSQLHSYLVLGGAASIEGEVRCDHIVVSGEIRGAVYSTELLEIQPNGRIIGDVFYNVLEVHGGARICGHLSHLDGADKVLHLAASEA
jgi:cytoskeletal protein CcmA (bactofilin family)